MRKPSFVVLCSILAASPVRAQSPQTINATPAQSPIRVDGRFDEAAWSSAPVATAFTQNLPSSGSPATQSTEVRVLYDNSAIFIAFSLNDSAPDSIAATLARRDFAGYSDWAHVYLDSYHDRRTAFRFSVNPAGVKLQLSSQRRWANLGSAVRAAYRAPE